MGGHTQPQPHTHTHTHPHLSLSWAEVKIQTALKPLLDEPGVTWHLAKAVVPEARYTAECDMKVRDTEDCDMEECDIEECDIGKWPPMLGSTTSCKLIGCRKRD